MSLDKNNFDSFYEVLLCKAFPTGLAKSSKEDISDFLTKAPFNVLLGTDFEVGLGLVD